MSGAATAFLQSAARGIELALGQADSLRRMQGELLGTYGYGPVETPHRVHALVPGAELRVYGEQGELPLLIVPAPIKQPYIWDLAPPVSVVRRCLDAGLGVHMAAWSRTAGVHPAGLAGHVEETIAACVDHVLRRTGQQRLFLAGHSLGGTLAALYAALHPERVAGLVLLESPLSFGANAGAFAPLVASAGRSLAAARAFQRVPGTLLNLTSFAAAPRTFHWARVSDFLASLADRQAFATHLRVERWTLDERPLPGRLFGDILERLYRDDAFMQGRLELGGRRLSPRDLTMPLLSVAERRSEVIPPAAVLALHRAAASREKRLLWYGGDRGVALQHVGALVGERAHRVLWPQILGWLGQLRTEP